MTANWYTIRAAAGGAEVLLYGVIGGEDGVSAKQFAIDLKKHSGKTLAIRASQASTSFG